MAFQLQSFTHSELFPKKLPQFEPDTLPTPVSESPNLFCLPQSLPSFSHTSEVSGSDQYYTVCGQSFKSTAWNIAWKNAELSILFSKQNMFFSDWQYLKEATELKRHRRAAEMMSRGEGHPCRIKLHFLKNHQVITLSGEWAGTCLGKTCSHMKDSPHHSAILVHVYSAKQEISLRTAASKKYF